MTKSKTTPNYSQLQSELDEVLAKLQGSDVNVDEALVLYQKGLELVSQLEEFLRSAQNNIKQLKAKR